MSFVSIMVSADRSEKAGNRYRLARVLSGRFDARLTGIGARLIDTPPIMYADAYPYALPDLQKAALDDVKAVHEGYLTGIGGYNRAEWRGDIAEPISFLAEQSRAADLVIVGRRGPHDVFDRKFGVDPGEIVVQAGRPVLVVPPFMNELKARRVVVAWSDTREARRAVLDALPYSHAIWPRERSIMIGHLRPQCADEHGLADIPATPRRLSRNPRRGRSCSRETS